MTAQPQRIEAADDVPTDDQGPEQLFTCAKHGDFTGRKAFVRLGERRWDFDPTCPTCDGEAAAAKRREQLEREDRERQVREEARFAALGIPKRFRGCTLDNYEVTEGKEQERALRTVSLYCERFDTRQKVGGGLILLGRPGTGKSHLMCALALQLSSRCQPLYTDVLTIVGAIKGSWSKSAKEDEAAVISRFVAPDLLLIDEIGVQYGTDAERAMLHRIIDLRYQQLKPTIVAGNVNLDGLKAYIGERAVSRLQDNGGVVINFSWSDYRQR